MTLLNINAARTQQSLAPGNKVELFSLDLTNTGNSTVLYFSPSAIGSQEIKYNNITYTSVPIQATGFETSGQGTLPQPVLRMANVSNVAGALAQNNGDLVGAILTRIVTFEQFLDGGATPDPDAIFPETTWQIIQKTKANKLYIEWKCASFIDRNGDKLPKRMVWKSYCLWPYRRWTGTEFDYTNVQGCSWNGGTYYDTNNDIVTDPSKDVCGKQLRHCKQRFGATAPLPFGGFIGAGIGN